MNADIPTLKVFVRSHFISDRIGYDEAYAFGIQSVKGRALGFHVMTRHGAHYRNVPIHALTTQDGEAGRSLHQCQLWDCFSSKPVVHVFDYLVNHQAKCVMRGSEEGGTYLFTVDWLPDDNVRTGFVLQPDQNKCAHVMELDSGNIVALPTNRIVWLDGYFIGKSPDPRMQRYRTQSDVYQCEDYLFDVSKAEEYMYEGK
jgi:hypothetical protein